MIYEGLWFVGGESEEEARQRAKLRCVVSLLTRSESRACARPLSS